MDPEPIPSTRRRTPFRFLILSLPLSSIPTSLSDQTIHDFETQVGFLETVASHAMSFHHSHKALLFLMIRSSDDALLGSAVVIPLPEHSSQRMQLPGSAHKKYAELRELIILPDHRGKGLGQRLLGFLLNYTDRRHLRMKLDVWKSNKVAIHCYVKHGFKKVLWRHPASQWINDPENLFPMYNITEPKEKVFLYVRAPPSE